MYSSGVIFRLVKNLILCFSAHSEVTICAHILTAKAFFHVQHLLLGRNTTHFNLIIISSLSANKIIQYEGRNNFDIWLDPPHPAFSPLGRGEGEGRKS